MLTRYRFEEQLNTIFEVTHSSNFNTSIQAMMLIQQISATKHISADRFYRTLYESLLDPRLITTSKHILYLNLLYRALKTDVSIRRVKAFVKRLLQIIHLHEPPFICGVLYLIKELITAFPSIKAMFSTPEDNGGSEDEHYEDVPEDGAAVKDSKPSKGTLYDPRKRDPDHAHADLSCLWEILPLLAHYHPSVHVLASKLLNQQPITEKPDPTVYTLMNFLDKFAFKNAKTKAQVVHGTSIMQPMAGTSKAADYLITARGGDRLHNPVNSEQFWKMKIDDVREDEVFFHTYFEKAGKAKHASMKERKKKRAKDDEDEDESGEEEVWKALVNSRPDIEGEDDDDEGFSDMDMDDMSDDLEDDAGSDGGVQLNLGSDDEGADFDTAGQHDNDDDDGLGDEGFDLDDEDAFVDSDEDIPIDMAMDDESDLEDQSTSKPDKAKDKDKEKKSRKKRKLKHLPTFASVDDYAKLIGDDSE